MELRGFSGNYSKKKVELRGFLGIILKKSGVTLFFRESLEIRGYSGKMLKKKRSFSVFPCVDSRNQVHFWNFCHDSVIEDCSKIRNKA